MLSLMNAFSLKNCSTFISLHIFALGIAHEILQGLRKFKCLTVQENPNCFFPLTSRWTTNSKTPANVFEEVT